MARGWESKSVADQVEDAEHRSDKMQREVQSGINRKIADRIETLRQSKSRILQQLDRAANPAYRTTLSVALKEIERETIELSTPSNAT